MAILLAYIDAEPKMGLVREDDFLADTLIPGQHFQFPARTHWFFYGNPASFLARSPTATSFDTGCYGDYVFFTSQ